MLKSLVKVRLAALGGWLTGGGSRAKKTVKNSKGKTVLYAVLFAYVGIALAVLMFGSFSQIAKPFYDAHIDWLYFALFFISDFSLMLIGSIFLAKAQLYEARDNELLLAMPIPSRYILASRILLLLAVDVVLDLLVAVPVGVAWAVSCPVTAAGVFGFTVLVLLLPLLAVALSALLGWLISLFTRRVRNKAVMTTVFSLLFLAVYFFAVSKMQTVMTTIMMQGNAIAEKLRPVFFLYWLGKAAAGSGVWELLGCVLLIGAAFALTWVILSATFIRTVTEKRGFAKIVYTEKAQKASGAFAALYQREMRRFLSCSAYLMNAGLGVVFVLIGGIALFIFGGRIQAFLSVIPGFSGLLCPALLLLLAMMSGMTAISGCAVSLEGNTIWIAQSMPVDTAKILNAKLALHYSLMLPPTLVAIAGIIFVARPTGFMLLAAIFFPLVFLLFSGALGLMADLRHANLLWTTEMQAVKSGIGIMVTLGVSWGLSIAIGIAGFVLRRYFPVEWLMLGVTLLLGVISWRILVFIQNKGAALYRDL